VTQQAAFWTDLDTRGELSAFFIDDHLFLFEITFFLSMTILFLSTTTFFYQ
jgi:hypothetical protein